LTKLLIVDDAAFMRLSIKKMLEKHDYEVVAEAANGIEAIAKYKRFKPDLVTMDVTMPEMNGLDALKEIKEYDPKAKVIMVTAMGQESLIKEAVMNGASSFIVKPFKEDKLVNVLDGVAGK
jgi:two-component system chemotaxis response regulator CheY